VYSLDLYETHETYAPGLACKGYFLPGARQQGPERPIRRRVIPQSVPLRVELTADPAALNAPYEMLGGADFETREGNRNDPEVPYTGSFQLQGSWRGRKPYFSVELSAPIRSQRGTIWAGLLGSKLPIDISGDFDFLLEQYGTMDPLLVVLVLYLLVFHKGAGNRLVDYVPEQHASHNDPLHEYERCYRLALRLCGDKGNIKSLNSTTSITGATLQVGIGCNPECFERWDPDA
jgi:hypothetical protein